MNPVSSFIKRYPQITFWAIAWSTWAFGWYMASLYPSDLWLLFIYFPFLAGVLVTAITEGREGLRTFFSRIVRWKVGIQWYVIALLAPVVIKLLALGLNLALGATMVANAQLPTAGDLVLSFIVENFLIIALGEEPGFRGFALPRLLVGRSALSAALILGVLHAIWHLPLFIWGSETALLFVVVISGSVLITWLFNKSNGSVLIIMLLHASLDAMGPVFNPLFTGADAERFLVAQAIVFVAMAILIPILTGKELGRKPEPGMDMKIAEQPVLAK